MVSCPSRYYYSVYAAVYIVYGDAYRVPTVLIHTEQYPAGVCCDVISTVRGTEKSRTAKYLPSKYLGTLTHNNKRYPLQLSTPKHLHDGIPILSPAPQSGGSFVLHPSLQNLPLHPPGLRQGR